jgi:ribonuclease D
MKLELPEVIEKEQINDLPKISFEGEITLVEDSVDVRDAVLYLRQSDVIGFDTETKPSFKKGKSNQHSVALLQLSSLDRVFLFRLNKIGLTPDLADLLSDNSIIKSGAAIHDDIKALKLLYPFVEGGFIDVQDQADNLGIEVKSLRKLTAMLFNRRLSKAQRLSNWEADNLTKAQALYAGTDAWISLMIYIELLKYK